MKVFCSLVVSLGLLLLSRQASAEDPILTFAAGAEAKAQGIATYRYSHSGQILNIELLNKSKRKAGSMVVDFNAPEGTTIELTMGSRHTHIVWNTREAQLMAKNMDNGEVSERKVNKGKWLNLSNSQSVFDSRQHDLEVVAIALSEAKVNLGLNQWQLQQQLEQNPLPANPLCSGSQPSEKVLRRCPPSCEGPVLRGSSAADTRSACCNSAHQDAAVKCWNDLCIGCCRYFGCDAACALGDYFCFCGESGQACSPPLWDCPDDTWPPPCV